MRTLLLSALLATLACNGGKEEEDVDGDGYRGAFDCDDKDPAIHPDADESCDGIDNDCDGTIDEGLTVRVWPDLDADGFGDASAPPTLTCTPLPDTVENAEDCDDTRADINPRQAEDCSTVDLNCDGDPTLGASVSWYLDDDGDGYGQDTNIVTSTCDPMPGRVLSGGDCDDTSASVYPGADEYCDGIDGDCDGSVDEDAVDETSVYADVDNDGYGDPTVAAVGCPAPGLVANDLDCDDGNELIYPGAPELCNAGIDDDCDPGTDEELTALWYADLDSDGYGGEVFADLGCNPPPGYIQLGGDCDDNDPLLNPDLTPGCIQEHCGPITASETWRATVEHHVTCDVVVEGGARPTLTIDDGAVVLFEPVTELRVAKTADGKLLVDGDTLGVLFDSIATTPAMGDWDGLTIGSHDQGSVLTGLGVLHAGANGKGGIVIEGADVVLSGVTSQLNLGDGVYVSGDAEPLIHDGLFADNADNGLYFAVGAGLSRATAAGGAGPSFENNVVTGNLGRPISIPGSHADELATSSTLAGNDTDEIELLTGTLRFEGTWYQHGLPYVVADNATISVEDGPQTRLTIEPSVELYFGSSAGLEIGNGAGATLTIDAVADPVLMSATDDVLSTSDNWDGVTFGPDDAGSTIRGLTIEYGGANGKGNLYVNGSAPLFSDVTSRYSDSSGLYVSGAAAAPEIRDSTFVDNDEHGVYVASSSGIARSTLGPTFTNNLLTRNGLSSAVMPPNFVGELDPSTQFTGNTLRIGIHGGDVLEDALWRKLDDDYQVYGDVDIGGPQDPVVDIEPRVVLYFDRDASLTAGVVDDGALHIDVDDDVVMTSSDPAPGEGDWEGIEIGRNGALRAQTRIRGLTIEYAGGSDVQPGGAVEVTDRDTCLSKEPYVDLDEITILASSKAGLYLESWTTFSADSLHISGALEGCFQYYNPSPSCPYPDVVSLSNNVCADGVIFGSWPLAAVDELAGGNTFPGPVVINDGTLTTSVTMPLLPVPYRFTDLVDIKDDSNPVLTVAGGNVLEFATDAGLQVGASRDGGLVIGPNTLLTSAEPVPSRGDWAGVRLASRCTTVDLDGVTIEYGGGNNKGDLWLDNCGQGSVSDLTLTDSSSCGLYLTGNSPLVGAIGYSNNAVGDLCP